MIAIITRVRPATNTRGTYILATFAYRFLGQRQEVRIAWDHSGSPILNHQSAAKILWNRYYSQTATLVGSASMSAKKGEFVHLFQVDEVKI